MPTNLNRVQVLMTPELHADVRTLAAANRRSLSYVCASLIQHALNDEKVKEMLKDAHLEGFTEPVKADPRTRINQPMTWDVDGAV